MTVEELIIELQKLPQDLVVVTDDTHYMFEEDVYSVTVERERYGRSGELLVVIR